MTDVRASRVSVHVFEQVEDPDIDTSRVSVQLFEQTSDPTVRASRVSVQVFMAESAGPGFAMTVGMVPL